MEHFDIDAVPEAERRDTARVAADAVLTELRKKVMNAPELRVGADCGAGS